MSLVNAIFLRALPALFRTARRHELIEAELKNLVGDISKLHKADPTDR